MSKYTDSDILAMGSVPIAIAADYLGMPPDRLRRAMFTGQTGQLEARNAI